MYAIVEIAGQQFKVSKDQQVYVHRLSNKVGETVAFDRILLIDNDGQVTVGAPAIEGASVEATILEHMKGDKVTVFKKKRRKGYKLNRGHRQYMTFLQISSILEKPAGKTAAKKAQIAEVEEENVEKVSTKKPTEAKKTKAAPENVKSAEANTGQKTDAKAAEVKTDNDTKE